MFESPEKERTLWIDITFWSHFSLSSISRFFFLSYDTFIDFGSWIFVKLQKYRVTFKLHETQVRFIKFSYTISDYATLRKSSNFACFAYAILRGYVQSHLCCGKSRGLPFFFSSWFGPLPISTVPLPLQDDLVGLQKS